MMVRKCNEYSSPLIAGASSTTSCPSFLSNATVSSTPFTQSAWTFFPSIGLVENAILNLPGFLLTSFKNGPASGIIYAAPTSGPLVASNIAAESRTERVSTCSIAKPSHASPIIGPVGVRPRVGLSPNNPHADDGMRIEPPPSPPVANGTIRAATAAPEPPDEPPVVRVVSHGLSAGPSVSDSV